MDKFDFMLIFVFLMSIVFCVFVGYALGQDELINKLCNKSNYDFCEVASYKLKM